MRLGVVWVDRGPWYKGKHHDVESSPRTRADGYIRNCCRQLLHALAEGRKECTRKTKQTNKRLLRDFRSQTARGSPPASIVTAVANCCMRWRKEGRNVHVEPNKQTNVYCADFRSQTARGSPPASMQLKRGDFYGRKTPPLKFRRGFVSNIHRYLVPGN